MQGQDDGPDVFTLMRAMGAMQAALGEMIDALQPDTDEDYFLAQLDVDPCPDTFPPEWAS